MTMQDLIESILKDVDLSAKNHENGDLFRANNCTSSAHGKAQILRLLGIPYDFGTYMDGDFHLVGYFMVDYVTLVKNGEINWRAYADTVVDKWGEQCIVAER